MSLQRVQTTYGIGLQVTAVTPGSPSQAAGLELGDVLLLAGTVSLQQAQSNEHGVELIQSAVTLPGNVTLTVLDVRTNQATHVAVAPQNLGSPIAALPAPTVATF